MFGILSYQRVRNPLLPEDRAGLRYLEKAAVARGLVELPGGVDAAGVKG